MNRRTFTYYSATALLFSCCRSVFAQNDEAGQILSDLLREAQSDPEIAHSSKLERDEFDRRITSGLEAAPIRASKSATKISTRANELIIAFEITNRKTYEVQYTSPVWPYVHSGLTIGIGYDLGNVNPSEFQDDWGEYLKTSDISALSKACGVRGTAAGALVKSFASVEIDWDKAYAQYLSETLPRHIGATETALSNTKTLTGDSLGALVSIVYNRGASFASSGSNYREMRAVKLFMQQQQFDRIPCQIRSMMRLWIADPKARGVLMRREAEASLFEAGL
jgi:GH24 family phage-related lysozyme (muramidase)